jgi:hypothetical protein
MAILDNPISLTLDYYNSMKSRDWCSRYGDLISRPLGQNLMHVELMSE